MAAACKVCKAKDQTIRALELANQTLLEMVNLQRAIPAATAPAPTKEYPPLTPIEGGGEEDEIEETLARLNEGDLPEEEAERLMSRLQAFNTVVERD